MITAQFDADFSAFSTEVGKAEQQLNLFEMSTAKTGTAIQGMGTTTTKTTPQMTAMANSMRQFDGVLSSVGIHIGPLTQGMSDLGAASGKSASQLGLFTTAGLVAGAAMAGWKIGRAIADFFGLDQAIAQTTARLMGWGDLVKETAGAKADVLALASQRAGRAITDMTEAMKVNQEWVDARKKGAVEAKKADEEWAKAMDAVNIAGQNNNAVLKTIAGSTVAAAKAALDHGVSMDTVATAYKLTASQIAAVKAALEAEQEAIKASEKEHARITAELKEHWDAVLAIRDKALGKDAIEKATQWTEAIFLLGGSIKTLSQEQLTDLQKSMTEAMEAMARNGNLTAEGAAQFNDFALAAANASTALRPVVDTTVDLVAAQAQLVAEADAATAALIKQGDTAKAVAQGAADGWGLHPGGQAPSSGGLVQAGRIGGDMFLVNPKTGEIVQKLERKFGDSFLGWGPPGPPPTVNLTVQGNILTQDELGKVVSDALMSRITRTGTVV